MPRNVYFSQAHIPEQNLYEDLQIEALKIYGQDVYYLPRKILTRDMILNEDVEAQFDDAYMIEMYIENTEGFEGEGNLLSKFGLEIRDEATFIVARRTWNKLVGLWNNALENNRPNEGDLIYMPMSQSFFEISFVEHESPFYQLANLPVYKLQARLFEFNDEDFSTGIEEIDDIEAQYAYTLSVAVNDITGDFEKGMRMYQVISRDDNGTPTKWISGEIASMEAIGGSINAIQLELTDFEVNDGDVTGFIVSTLNDIDTYLVDDINTPTISANLYEIYDLNNTIDETFHNDENAQNWTFEQEGDDIIDFSETNPFGEPT
jgi:hypothetical protein